jgi:hypothetical protein
LFRKTFTEEHILAAQTLASFHFQWFDKALMDKFTLME